MRASLRRRLVIAVGLSLGAGLASTTYVLSKFRTYEDNASRMMSGDQRSVLVGHLVEAKVKALQELASSSASSEQANDAYKEKLQAIADDLKSLSRDRTDKSLDEARRLVNELSVNRSESMEDLFIDYRNVKTTAFNLYRLAWANKWMTVAKGIGLLINDLDNLPYHSGEKAVVSVNVKIAQLTAIITSSPIPQASKLLLFGQLNILKGQAARYGDAIQHADKVRDTRVDQLKELGGVLKKYNDAAGRSMLQFGNEARSEVFRAILVYFLFMLFAMFWFWFVVKRFQGHVEQVAAHISRQLAGWITSGGNVTAQEFKIPERPDVELIETYQTIDQVMRRINVLRKEDILVKRLLNVPFLLVNRARQAIFWNSALSILAKVRALEEMGPVAHGNLLRFLSGQNKVLDPIEKAFTENKEIGQLALLRVGDDGIAVHAVCTPVLGPDHQAEYVMVHIRDLREENRKAEAELDRQLESVRQAVGQLRGGALPEQPAPTLRRPVAECLTLLREFGFELQEKSEVLSSQVETMQERMLREANLKKAVHARTSQVKEEVGSLQRQLEEMRRASEDVSKRLGQVEARNKLLGADYDEIKTRGLALIKSLSEIRSLLSGCLEKLDESEEISKRVRSNERAIRGILEKSTLLNANNSILSSKRELTPTDVVAITEHVIQLMSQFERSYRFIEQSVSEVEQGMKTLGERLRENLADCVRLAREDQAIIKAVEHSDTVMAAGQEEVAHFTRELNALRSFAGRIGLQIINIEKKIQNLVQIGSASIQLQTQLDAGFQGMFEQLEQQAPSIGTDSENKESIG